jgi:hypothetical protein
MVRSSSQDPPVVLPPGAKRSDTVHTDENPAFSTWHANWLVEPYCERPFISLSFPTLVRRENCAEAVVKKLSVDLKLLWWLGLLFAALVGVGPT